jgi:murein L,D-transpeptidase YcbB/YkuD
MGWRTLVVVAALLFSSCAPDDRAAEISASIRQLAEGGRPSSVDEHIWTDLSRFYAARASTPAWVDDADPMKVHGALRVLKSAVDHGLDPANYGEPAIERMLPDADDSKKAPPEPSDLARLDVQITTGLLALGRDVSVGRTQPQRLDPRWKRRRQPPDLPALLERAANGEIGWLASVQPQHPEYTALQHALEWLRAQPSPDDDQIRLLAINLERWRWMPDDLGARHILVNVPAFHLAVRENGRAVLDMKVVVGEEEPERRTPIFSADMGTVVFSPYWNVPDSIAEGETVPALLQDPSFLKRNNIEIVRKSKSGAAPIDPKSVDWDDEREVESLLFRQRPGPQNALGHVKFLFPNPFSVYLHDTPADSLFARPGRALSHGCVRLEQPEALAHYLLRDSPQWDDERIREAMHAEEEKHVALKDKLPVHIVYFTAWPKNDGGFERWPDVYGYDAQQMSSRPPATLKKNGIGS